MTCLRSHSEEVIELGFTPRSEDKLWALPSLLPIFPPVTYKGSLLNSSSCSVQAKKKFFDTELENLERQQKQQVEKMEQDHAVRRREEAKRIRLEQERDYTQFQEQLKLMKKEVNVCWVEETGWAESPRMLSVASSQNLSSTLPQQQGVWGSCFT